MNKEALNQILNTYIKENLSPTEEEKKLLKEKYDELQSILLGQTYQSGSYGRFTAITPINDLDVIWVLPEDFNRRFSQIVKALPTTKVIHPEGLDLKNILEDLAKKLREEYDRQGFSYHKIEAQSHSVGIYFDENEDAFSIDLVPAVPSGHQNEFEQDIYWVPEVLYRSKKERKLFYKDHYNIGWILSDPRGYKAIAKEINEMNDNFRKATKFAKNWKRLFKSKFKDFKLKSFHIEVLMMAYFSENKNATIFDALLHIFTVLPSKLSTPQLSDRGDPKRHIDDYVNDLKAEEIDIIIRASQRALSWLSKLSRAETTEEANNLLDDIISNNNPTVESSTIRVSLNEKKVPLVFTRDAKKWVNL